MRKLAIALAAFSIAALAGCAASGPVQIGQGRYMMSDQSSWTWSGGSVVQDLVKKGAEFCAREGKSFELLNSTQQDAQSFPVARYASGSIEFTCK